MIWIKRSFVVVLFAVLIYFFWPLLGEIRAAANLFKNARWEWLPIIVATQALSYFSLAWLNSLALQPFPGGIKIHRLAALLTSIAFIEIAIPSAGASGVVLRARLLGKRGGYSVEASTLTWVVEQIFLAIALGTIGLFGLVYMLRQGEMTWQQITLYVCIGLGILSFIWFIWGWIADIERCRRILRKILATMISIISHIPFNNRFPSNIREINQHAVEERMCNFHKGMEQLNHGSLWKFILAAYGRVILDVTTLGVCFIMFGQMILPGTLLTGYGLILVVSGLAALPGGLGMADLSVPVIFSQLGSLGSIALVAGLTFRIVGFWLVRFIGFISWLFLEVRT